MNRATPSLLIVCTGNICRSPMAEVIARDEARRSHVDVRVLSAGTNALVGNGATERAREAIEALGLSLSNHVAEPLTRDMVADATLVIAVTNRHRDDLRRYFPRCAEKIVSFDDVTGLGDLDDPFGGDLPEFSRLAERLRRGMPAILARLQTS